MTTLREAFDELVEDFTRLGGAQTDQLRSELAGCDLQLYAVKDGNTGSMGYNALVLLNGSDLNGDLLIEMEDVLNGQLLIIVPLQCLLRLTSTC
jgi:hypothetical protein